MDNETYKWHMQLVCERFMGLNLSYEQAEQVYLYERDRDLYSDKDYFSFWEEQDCNLAFFQRILTPEQLEIFLPDHQAGIKRHETYMQEMDKEEFRLQQLRHATASLQYYQETFIPTLQKNEDIRNIEFLFAHDRAKVNYIRKEQAKYLGIVKKGILVNHFRYNRTLAPNELKYHLLIHDRDCIWPDYRAFYNWCDQPTKAVADFLSSQMDSRVLDTTFIQQCLDENKRFFQQLFEEHYADTRGWHVVNTHRPDEEIISDFRMAVLLVDWARIFPAPKE